MAAQNPLGVSRVRRDVGTGSKGGKPGGHEIGDGFNESGRLGAQGTVFSDRNPVGIQTKGGPAFFVEIAFTPINEVSAAQG